MKKFYCRRRRRRLCRVNRKTTKYTSNNNLQKQIHIYVEI